MRERPTTQLSWLDEVADGPRPSVLLIEPDDSIARVLRRNLLAAGFQVEVVTDASDLTDVLTRAASWDAVIIDFDLGTIDALTVKRLLRQAGSLAPVTILSADSTAASAVRCLQAGALHYLTKPVELEDLVAKTRTSTGLTAMRRIATGSSQDPTPLLIGETPPIARLRLAVHRVGRQEVPVLLHGESGTGKELVARSLHDASPRAGGPFVAINLAAVPEGVIDSELFGHRRGAFTGAVAEHPGMLVSAHGGTLLLDEIGDMPLTVQGRLLRFLQEGEVRPIGSNTAIAVDVRVIAATHIDLPAAVAAGRFREDLYYRLNVASLQVPPLRERLGDVPLLAAHFLRKHGGGRRRELTHAALELLEAQPWPGNVRQLENTLRNAMAVALDDVIDYRDFPMEMWDLAMAHVPRPPPNLARGSGIMRRLDAPPEPRPAMPSSLRPLADARREATMAFERQYLMDALALAGGSISEAARLAGMDRANFRRLLRRHDLGGGRRGSELDDA